MLARGLIISRRFVEEQHLSTGPPTYQVIKVANMNQTNMMKSTRWNSRVSSRMLCLLRETVLACHKRIGLPCWHYLPLPLLARYKLPCYQTTRYRQFQCLQRLPCWKSLVISFCSSLGSTFLFIERTTIDPLYLWVIKTLSWRCCQGVKRSW